MTLSIQGMQFLESEVDEDGQRTYPIFFLVESTTGLDGPPEVLQTPNLPTPGSIWNVSVNGATVTSSDPWAWCKANIKIAPYEVQDEKVKVWKVTFTFSTKPQTPNKQRCMDNPVTDPLLEPPKLSGSFVKEKEPATTDRFGSQIITSSQELIKGPQVEFDVNKPTIKIEQNVASSFQAYILPGFMCDCVNQFPIWGFPPRTVKLSQPTWDRKYYGTCLVYYTRVLEFEVNKATWDRTLLDEGTKVLNGHWDQATGDWVLDDIGGEPPDRNNPQHFIRFTDRNGQQTRVLLDGRGQPSGVRIIGRRPIVAAPGGPSGPGGTWTNQQQFAITSINPGGSSSPLGEIVVVSAGHGLSSGDYVYITGCVGADANGRWTINVRDVNTFTLNASDGLGAVYCGGGVWQQWGPITGITNATPNVVTTNVTAPATNARVLLENTEWADGVWPVINTGGFTFSLTGSVAVFPLDNWNDFTLYAVGDTVIRLGVSYICLFQNSDDPPPSANWQVITTPDITEAAGPGQVFVSKYDEADFLLLGVPTSF